jgi:hypothetical protein
MLSLHQVFPARRHMIERCMVDVYATRAMRQIEQGVNAWLAFRCSVLLALAAG